jgi:hypothetical protein
MGHIATFFYNCSTKGKTHDGTYRSNPQSLPDWH